MNPLLLALDANTALADALAEKAGLERLPHQLRRFPDGESYLRLLGDCRDREVIILCGLQQPDAIALPLLFCADTLRELGARAVGVIAPYLAYMRQDQRFHAGEAVTSRIFAQLLSAHVDWLLTIDPHLHRYASLDAIYTIPAQALSAMPLVAQWLRAHVERPLLIGPDSESAQWVAALAQRIEVPYLVLEKLRRGDRDVEISVPDVARWTTHTPVLIDDIISTGHTMLETIGHLRRAGLCAPVCIGVHGLFAGDAYERLIAGGAARVVTTNSVPHPSNAIDVSALLAKAIAQRG
jgi:ribose-phosphate pyrophosphokinase